jgi:hypothetical protein
MNASSLKNGVHPRRDVALGKLGLGLVAVLSIAPLALIWLVRRQSSVPALDFFPVHSSALIDWGGKLLVVVVMGLAIGLRAWADRRAEPRSARLTVALMTLAGLMVTLHWYCVDRVWADWQRGLYLDILGGEAPAPHRFRWLPYGFTRFLEWLTGDWWFASLSYRWFFTYWFLWGCYRFARLFHAPAEALATLVPVVLLYPLSVQYYCGQLTDPLSHALFILALIYVVEDRWIALSAALFLGVLAKESVVVVVPAYLVSSAAVFGSGVVEDQSRGSTTRRAPFSTLLLRTTALGLACVAAFLLARLPLGWHLSYDKINGTTGLMIGSNLGFDEPALGIKILEYTPAAAPYHNYLHPLLFVATFVPFIAWNWKKTDRRLRALFLSLPPLLLASNLCFGWMYESRNYVPLLPLLATMALPRRCGREEGEREKHPTRLPGKELGTSDDSFPPTSPAYQQLPSQSGPRS